MWKPLSVNRFSLLVLLSCCPSLGLLAQPLEEEKDHPGASDAHKIGVFHLVKAFPSFSGFDFAGGGLAYETGAGIYPFSLNASARYFKGSGAISHQVDTIPEHLRFELQMRWWPVQTFRALFAAVLFNVCSTGGVSIGGATGYHVFITKQIVAEASIGVQTRNQTMNYQSGIILRYGLSLGLIFPKMLRYGY